MWYHCVTLKWISKYKALNFSFCIYVHSGDEFNEFSEDDSLKASYEVSEATETLVSGNLPVIIFSVSSFES